MNSAERCLAISPNTAYETLARDEDLLRAAMGGSHAAFAELQKTYSHRVYQRILSITRNREDAEDALQDAFLSAYLALPSFEGRSKLSSWLTRIGINAALMILRRRRCRPETSFEQLQDFDGDCAYIEVRDDALNPEQLYDQQERCDAIRCALQRLDPKLRSAIGIWLSEEHSMKEIAQDLGLSVASVKARLHRARKRLLRSPALASGKRIRPTGKKSSNREPSSPLEFKQRTVKSLREDRMCVNSIKASAAANRMLHSERDWENSKELD
ncbi:MAG TPA: sigma-70 family RNA polymerase sigma factor [Terracidiphilus sp.]|nr:sigma-70 family RNA polymerase sigma factor [Terracidiphilus sp.]